MTTGRLFEEKIAIIGGGPAGLSCAFYLAEKGYKPTVFEKNEKPSMLVYGIPSFKLEKDVVEAEIDVMRQMGGTNKLKWKRHYIKRVVQDMQSLHCNRMSGRKKSQY